MKYTLEATVVVAGAVIMAVELVGSRVLAPHLGTSLPVWTSIIGVVLGSLSIGYWWGGRLADKKPSYADLSIVLLVAATGIAAIKFIETRWIGNLLLAVDDVRLGAVIAAVSLFAIPNVALGMISPYVVSLRLRTLARRGSVVGNLSAFSTVGSIVGTFLAGFVLIPSIGHSMILLGCALMLVVLFAGISIVHSVHHKRLLWVSVVLGIAGVVWFYTSDHARPKGYTEIDTMYNRIWIWDVTSAVSGRKARVLRTDSRGIQSGMFLDDINHYFNPYLEFFMLAERYTPEIRRALMIGGGANSFAKYFHHANPSVPFDIVEVDPGMTEIAKKYFFFREDRFLSVHHADGRMFLRKSRTVYDVIYVDAFDGSVTIPYHLLSREAMTLAASRLSRDGVFILNAITPLAGKNTDLLRAIVTTLRSVYPHVDIYKVKMGLPDAQLQNVILVASKGNGLIRSDGQTGRYNRLTSSLWNGGLPAGAILSDELMPIEYLTMKVTSD